MTPFDPAAFGKRLADKMAAEGLTVRSAAEAIGVGRWVVWRALQGNGVRIEHYHQIAAWLARRPRKSVQTEKPNAPKGATH